MGVYESIMQGLIEVADYQKRKIRPQKAKLTIKAGGRLQYQQYQANTPKNWLKPDHGCLLETACFDPSFSTWFQVPPNNLPMYVWCAIIT